MSQNWYSPLLLSRKEVFEKVLGEACVKAFKESRPIKKLSNRYVNSVRHAPFQSRRRGQRLRETTEFFLGSNSGTWVSIIEPVAYDYGMDVVSEVDIETQSDSSYCIALTYRAVDSIATNLDPSEAVVRLLDFQGQVNCVAEYVAYRAKAIAIALVSQVAQQAQLPQIPQWVEEVLELEKARKSEQSLDVIFNNLDDLLLESKFQECNSILVSMPIGRLTNAQLLTVLTATLAARNKLPSRADFFGRVRALFVSRQVNADRLLVGLE